MQHCLKIYTIKRIHRKYITIRTTPIHTYIMDIIIIHMQYCQKLTGTITLKFIIVHYCLYIRQQHS